FSTPICRLSRTRFSVPLRGPSRVLYIPQAARDKRRVTQPEIVCSIGHGLGIHRPKAHNPLVARAIADTIRSAVKDYVGSGSRSRSSSLRGRAPTSRHAAPSRFPQISCGVPLVFVQVRQLISLGTPSA